MKKIKYLLFIILFLFISTDYVDAATAEHWGYDITHFTNGFFFDCTKNGYCPNSITTENFWGIDNNGNHMYPGFASGNATTVADSAGIMFAFAPNVAMKPGSIYSSRLYICNATSNYRAVNVNFTTGTSSSNVSTFATPLAENYYNGFFSVTKEPYVDMAATNLPNISLKNCVALTYIFEPSVNSSVVGYQFTTSSTITAEWVAVGYDFDYIGDVSQLSYTQVKNIIETSTLQTSVGIEEVKQDIAQVDQGISEVKQELSNVNESIQETNNTITNSDSSEATNEAGDFFSGFETDTFGLTSIITAPLDLIGSITSSSCSPLPLNVPFVNKTLNLPCMTTIYKKHFGSFLTIYQTITFGIIAYWVCVRIFALVKDFKNPDHDEIEVLDL